MAQPEPRQADAPFAQQLAIDRWPDVPTRVIAGADDRFFPADFQIRVSQDRLGITPDIIPGGHLVALSRPVELADRLLEYCDLTHRGVRARRPGPRCSAVVQDSARGGTCDRERLDDANRCSTRRSDRTSPGRSRSTATAKRSCRAIRGSGGPIASSPTGWRRSPAACSSAGHRGRRSRRDLEPELRRVDARAVRHRRDRRDPRQHQPGVPQP